MQYDSSSLRRNERALTEETARQLLQHGSYGILSLQEPEGGAYGVPLHYAWDNHRQLYMHAARQGHKLACLAACNRVSFCIVGTTHVLPEHFSTQYQSIILRGSMQIVQDPAAKQQALHLLLKKYTPQHLEEGQQYVLRALNKTHILQLTIETWCGKHGFSPS